MRRITDKERLDWLSRRTVVEQLWDSGDEQVTRLATFDVRGWGGFTLRKAIDSRIEAERRAESKRTPKPRGRGSK